MTHFKPVTHVIFDMDGLLLNTEDLYEKAYSHVINRYGKEYDWDLRKSICGRPAKDGYTIVCRCLNLPISADRFGLEVDEELVNLLPQADLMPGAHRLLEYLYHHKIPMAIASSSTRKAFNLKTGSLSGNFFKYFHHILLGPEDPRVKAGKPSPDIFIICSKMFPPKQDGNPFPPSSFLVFEDSEAGVFAALKAGMQVVHVPDQRLDVKQMKRDSIHFQPTIVIPSLNDFRPEMFGLPSFHSTSSGKQKG